MKPIIYIKVTAIENVNVYIYGGPNRDEATITIIKDNMMATIGQLYTIDASTGNGLLLVAFPD